MPVKVNSIHDPCSKHNEHGKKNLIQTLHYNYDNAYWRFMRQSNAITKNFPGYYFLKELEIFKQLTFFTNLAY